MPEHLTNRCTFDVCLLEKSELRKTLAGVVVSEAIIGFDGLQTEDQAPRQTQFELAVIAIGDAAHQLDHAQVGHMYRVQGFLNRKSLKSVKLRLHLTHIKPISVEV